MIIAGAALASIAVVLLRRRTALFTGAIAVLLLNPLLGLTCVGMTFVAFRSKRILAERQSLRSLVEDQHLVVDLTALGVTAGLSFEQAALTAGDRVGGPVASDVAMATRRIRTGMAHALPDGLLSAMFVSADRSAHFGAPIAVAISDVARHGREELAAKDQERLEKLPIKLLFPLAFLILPGFVLVAVVPPVVSGLSNLGL